MNEKLKNFLDAKKDAENKHYEDVKRKTLIDLGLYEKVYSPDNKCSVEFCLSEWDEENYVSKYYKKVPIEITDEEYREVEKYAKKEATEDASKNPVAVALTIIAWFIFIGGFIAGIVLGIIEVENGYYNTYAETGFSFIIAFAYWCISLVSGIMFLGFAEIIKLLNAIKRK